MKQIHFTDKAPAPIGPYSQAVSSNGTLYVSGQIAIDPSTGELKVGDIPQETRLVMENLKAIIEAAGASMEDVLKCSIFLSDMDYFGQVNEVYGEYFTQNPPARECVAVKTLPKSVNVEVSAIVQLS